MKNSRTLQNDNVAEPPIVGDHLAMDLLNTQVRSNGEVIEHWREGDDVLKWLTRCGVDTTKGGEVDRAQLLTQATTLRRLARQLLVDRRQDETIDIGGLNEFLRAYVSAPHLERNEAGELVLSRIMRGQPMASLLGPVAEAVAQLLVEGDFSLVKQCEHPDCILWFYDRTKARKRRWCSMAVCGNRHKAAQFRKRNRGKPAESKTIASKD